MAWIALALAGSALMTSPPSTQTMDLSGKWGFQTDPADFERSYDATGAFSDPLLDTVLLPGTTDTNLKGTKTVARQINRLTRLYEYVGPAWYQKEITIPPSWQDSAIELYLERILWISSVYVDGHLVGSRQSFSTPHTYDLTNSLVPGRHRLSICVDNRVPPSFEKWSHAYTEYTQTDWNGIIGRLELRSYPSLHIGDIQVYPNIKRHCAQVVCTIQNPTGSPVGGQLELIASDSSSQLQSGSPTRLDVAGKDRVLTVRATVALGDGVKNWDEFHPNLYQMKASLSTKSALGKSKDTRSVSFGMREYGSNDHHFQINGHPVSLRGTLECAVFPLTGFSDMSLAGWLKICRIIKSNGMNHIRFHSWCPPEAAFEAADQLGIYIQAELPSWAEVGKFPELDAFLKDEMDRILVTYGNHPSFVQLGMGNELRGDFDVLAHLVQHGKEKDPRHLYSGSTARKHLPEDQYYVSHQSSAGGMTTYGARGPETDYDLRQAYDVLKVPGVAHEVGQRAVYPNFDEISKYKGVLAPRNFDVFQETLARHRMLGQAHDFFEVSGRMTSMLYKESIEALLRTPNCGGFQLLQLNDFPGQGTALVGLYDAFWDSKGMITPERFREFCSPTVPLLRLIKRTYFNDEVLSASVDLYHYGESPLNRVPVTWSIKTSDGHYLESGEFAPKDYGIGTLERAGQLTCSLAKVTQAQKLTVTVSVSSEIHNSWDIWVYPRNHPEVASTNLVVAKDLEDATQALKAGKNVLFTPNVNLIDGKRASFQNHFWNPVMFQWEPMTMGTLVMDHHPALRDFPTEFYTSWQWWDIVSQSRLLQLDSYPLSVTAIVQPIDNYARCNRLGIIIEARVGNGKLLFASTDLTHGLDSRPAARQLLYSLTRYAASDAFQPKAQIELSQLATWFRKPSLMTGAKVVSVDSYETGNEPQNAIDGDPNSIWHTSYSSPGNQFQTNRQEEADYPHEIQIELAHPTTFKGFTLLPRNDGINGYIAKYEFYVSSDGKSWGEPVAKGAFARDGKEKAVNFAHGVTAKYVKFKALSGFEGQKWASIAELGLIPEGVSSKPL